MVIPTHILELNQYGQLEYQYGKNRFENVDLINTSDPDDLWFHIADVPSAHLVVKMSPEVYNDKMLYKLYVKKGAELSKSISTKYRNASNLKIVYTKIQNVSHINQHKQPGTVTLIGEKFQYA